MTRSRKLLIAVPCLALIVIIAAAFVRHLHWDQRVFYWFSTISFAPSTPSEAVGLGDFGATIEAKRIDGVDDNLSGITFDPERQQLWAVVNAPSLLLGISLEGELLSRHTLEGFHDVEGVTYLGNDRLALVEERRQTIIVMPVPALSGALKRDDFIDLRFDLHPEENNEYEGLTYDAIADRLLIAKERDPLLLYQIGDFAGKEQDRFALDVKDVTHTQGGGIFLDDVAGLAFDPHTSHLLALSHESRLLVELDGQGDVISYLLLEAGHANLTADVPQGEGVTLDDQGRLYLVSEPNLFYRFERPRADDKNSTNGAAAGSAR
ncbi:SdiA-regulated domain-containing protein [Halopseudomonas nanhaiensis]|uniref:SdiA-regulated domain-containing protein n=1 Tax=Halopseudomonas nanhaiensis TaxID=2830842 RepID=UPI001CBDE352|nr:SdiA-regulated domain-containing protein [Halopseudomonas nanhaiensis]UAW96851.1 SdiA-regulated domain-containing protein [Halopseudomonas nanhaiensis]